MLIRLCIEMFIEQRMVEELLAECFIFDNELVDFHEAVIGLLPQDLLFFQQLLVVGGGSIREERAEHSDLHIRSRTALHER